MRGACRTNRSSAAAPNNPGGPITVTAHALPVAAFVLACAAVVDTLLGVEKPFGAAQRRRLSRPDALPRWRRHHPIIDGGLLARAYANRRRLGDAGATTPSSRPRLCSPLLRAGRLWVAGNGATILVGAAVFVASRETTTTRGRRAIPSSARRGEVL